MAYIVKDVCILYMYRESLQLNVSVCTVKMSSSE